MQGLFTRPYVLALLSVHFYFAAYFISIVAVPQSLAGRPDWLVGLVVGSLGISGMLTRPAAGVWVDSGSRQRWLRIGAAGTAIAFVGYALGPGPWAMLGLRLVHGVAMGLYTTALLAMVAGAVPASRRGLGVGVYQSANAAAQLYAAALAVSLAAATSFRVVFLVGAVACVIALALGALVSDVAAPSPAAARPWRERQWVSWTALTPALVFLTMTTTIGAVQAFLPLFVLERDLGNAGVFYTVYALALLPGRLLAGALSDRIGRARVMLPALVMGAVALMLLSVTHSQGMLMAVALLYGAGFASVQVTVVALVVDRTPPENLGAGMATYTMAWDVGAVLGGVVLGVVVEATSYAATFALCGVLPMAGVLLYAARLLPRRQRSAAAVE